MPQIVNNQQMKFICYSQWQQLPKSADLLFSEGERNSLFLSRIWLENMTAHALDEGYSMCLACVIEGDEFLAILPMMMCPQGSLKALSSRFTTLFSLLFCDDCHQDLVLNCLAQGLAQLPEHPIRFEPVDADDHNMVRLQECMESHGFQSHPFFRFYNWVHHLNGQSFKEYMSERPANLRNTIRRKQNKLEREHGYAIKLFEDAGIDQALKDYVDVYKASWKANEFFSDFTPALVKSLSRKGWLRLGVFYIDSKPIAAQIWFVVYSKANIYRLVYDESWKAYSPGSILTQHLMQHVIDVDKVSEIDFLTGNESYKQDWMTVRKERLGFIFEKKACQKYNWKNIFGLMKSA